MSTLTAPAEPQLELDLPPGTGRIVVAMSGGVDSSVSAALLAEAGYDVVGITLQLYDAGAAQRRAGACCAGQDLLDARRIAEHLGIAHYVLDYESRFSAAVIDDFAAAYAAGETPIPCVRCNQTVKFTDLLQVARDLGAAALVTGHYIRRIPGTYGAELHRALDAERDQSYFLFATTRDQLDFLRFPLGTLSKTETRRHALRLGLAVAGKRDSQDICFVPDGRYANVVAKLRPEAFEPGDITHVDGRVLGRHGGVANFTIGQRRGLGLGGGDDGELRVVRIDAPARRVMVGPPGVLLESALTVRDLNWLGDHPLPADGQDVTVKIRSSQPAVPARAFSLADGRARVVLEQPIQSLAPGQACVFYTGERVLGGGWIERPAGP